jgi:urea carboxylase-associated protein 2
VAPVPQCCVDFELPLKGSPVTLSTADPFGARAHARSQAGTVAATQPTIPASSATDLPDGVEPGRVVWDERLGPGGYAVRRLPRGSRLRITDLDGDACAGLMVHNARRPEERLNVADTVKLQWNAYLGPGKLLLSDQGRVLLSILADTAGTHDALCGTSTAARNRARYGSGDNFGPTPNGRDRFLLALAKHGLGRRDLAQNVNLFKGVRVEEDGGLTFLGDRSAPGAFVELRAELDVLVSVVNVPHGLDPRPAYTATPLRCTAWAGPPTASDDPLRTATPESRRAFQNTEDELLSWRAHP